MRVLAIIESRELSHQPKSNFDSRSVYHTFPVPNSTGESIGGIRGRTVSNLTAKMDENADWSEGIACNDESISTITKVACCCTFYTSMICLNSALLINSPLIIPSLPFVTACGKITSAIWCTTCCIPSASAAISGVVSPLVEGCVRAYREIYNKEAEPKEVKSLFTIDAEEDEDQNL